MPDEPSRDLSEAPDPDGRIARLRRRLRSRRVVVRDRSMEPAFRPGDRLFVDPQAFRGRAPSYDDVVIVVDPTDTDRFLIKRVVGVPGDFIRVHVGGVERRATGATDTAPPPTGALEEIQVPFEHFFVLSDRTARTRDSRQFGPIARRAVLGRVWHRYYPADRAGPV